MMSSGHLFVAQCWKRRPCNTALQKCSYGCAVYVTVVDTYSMSRGGGGHGRRVHAGGDEGERDQNT
jgi:hypothetical protein